MKSRPQGYRSGVWTSPLSQCVRERRKVCILLLFISRNSVAISVGKRIQLGAMEQTLDQKVLNGVYETCRTKDGWEGFEARGSSCSWCCEPVRLRATARGGTNSHAEYFKSCGNRRSTRCPSCADRYRKDARMLVLSGLDGGKGISEEIRSHPVVFATLTAPSFGAVHRSLRRDGRNLPCRPGRTDTCIHG